MLEFDDHWRFITQRSNGSFPTVQEYTELKHVYELMKGCESYLEVGTAEGNSLYVLAHALKPGSRITYVDWDENHTRGPREAVIRLLTEEGYGIAALHGDTRNPDIIARAGLLTYDVVLIDAGHSYQEALSDARHYGHLANKYILFHDVCLPEVNRAFVEFSTESGLPAHKFVNSENFGYGIIECQ